MIFAWDMPITYLIIIFKNENGIIGEKSVGFIRIEDYYKP